MVCASTRVRLGDTWYSVSTEIRCCWSVVNGFVDVWNETVGRRVNNGMVGALVNGMVCVLGCGIVEGLENSWLDVMVDNVLKGHSARLIRGNTHLVGRSDLHRFRRSIDGWRPAVPEDRCIVELGPLYVPCELCD